MSVPVSVSVSLVPLVSLVSVVFVSVVLVSVLELSGSEAGSTSTALSSSGPFVCRPIPQPVTIKENTIEREGRVRWVAIDMAFTSIRGDKGNNSIQEYITSLIDLKEGIGYRDLVTSELVMGSSHTCQKTQMFKFDVRCGHAHCSNSGCVCSRQCSSCICLSTSVSKFCNNLLKIIRERTFVSSIHSTISQCSLLKSIRWDR